MRLGIGSYTYSWAIGAYGWGGNEGLSDPSPMSALDLIDRAKQLEISVVQICVKPELHGMSHEELHQLSEYADSQGIEIGTKGREPEHLLLYLKIARQVRSKLVRTIFTEASP